MAERPQRRHSTRSWSALRVRCSGRPAPKDLPLTGCARDRPMVTASVSGWGGSNLARLLLSPALECENAVGT
eukprot:1394182-Amphidinium_carterae.1